MKKPFRKYLIVLGIMIALFLVYTMQVDIPTSRLTSGRHHQVKNQITTQFTGVVSSTVLKFISR